MNINNNDPLVYAHNILVNKCSGSCNNINDPYAELCVPDIIKDMNIKVFKLISRINDARNLSWRETCTCKCRLDESVCKIEQRWNNNNKCRGECKELIEKGRCNDGFIWNPSRFECECDKSCDVGEHLDYENCNCRKK